MRDPPEPSKQRMQGQVAIVTGSGRGIGKAIAMALAEEGCGVVLVARSEHEIRRTEREIASLGCRAKAIRGDVSCSEDVRRVVGETVAAFHRLDILVNNAGTAIYKPLSETTECEWDRVMATNLKGVFLFTREVLPLMKEQGHGTIVNISSGSGRRGEANFSAYCASKFGVVGFTQAVAEEASKHGIKMYAVQPNCVDTQLFRELFGVVPRRKPEDIARRVLPLCLAGSGTRSGCSLWIPPKDLSLSARVCGFAVSLLPRTVRTKARAMLRWGFGKAIDR